MSGVMDNRKVWQFQAAVSGRSGTLGDPVNFGASTDATQSVAWGDFDSDGDLDLAAGNTGSQNAVYLNNGNGAFGDTVNFGTGFETTFSVAWGDFDGDGDLAEGNYPGPNTVEFSFLFVSTGTLDAVFPPRWATR